MSDVDDTIKEVMGIAKDLAEGRLTPAQLKQKLSDEVRELFAYVAGPDDPLWEIQVDVARQVLAQDGIPHEELREWAVVHHDSPESAARAQPIGENAYLRDPTKMVTTSDDADETPAALGEYEDHPGTDLRGDEHPADPQVVRHDHRDGSQTDVQPTPVDTGADELKSVSDMESAARKLGCRILAVCAIAGCQHPATCTIRMM